MLSSAFFEFFVDEPQSLTVAPSHEYNIYKVIYIQIEILLGVLDVVKRRLPIIKEVV